MTIGYEQLKTIAETPEFQRICTDGYSAIRNSGLSKQLCIQHMIDRLTSKFGMMNETSHSGGTTMVLYLTGTRAKQPACIVVSANIGQLASPSAEFVFYGAGCMIQVFDGGADDGLETAGPAASYRIESKSRSLQC